MDPDTISNLIPSEGWAKTVLTFLAGALVYGVRAMWKYAKPKIDTVVAGHVDLMNVFKATVGKTLEVTTTHAAESKAGHATTHGKLDELTSHVLELKGGERA